MASFHPRALALDFGRVLTRDPDPTCLGDLWPRAAPGAAERYAVHRHAYDRGDLDAGAYWSLVTGQPAPDLDLWVGADVEGWAQARTEFHDLLQGLLDRGTPMAIVSNMPPGLGPRFVARWPWLQRIPHRFFSADLGRCKPEPEFYQAVLAATGWDPARVLFVDDLEVNLAGARDQGMEGLLFTGAEGDLRKVAEWVQGP